jgi:predicted Rossmann-fold nucleotide-binding protein
MIRQLFLSRGTLEEIFNAMCLRYWGVHTNGTSREAISTGGAIEPPPIEWTGS